TITNTDKDTANVAKIAEVQLANGATADALQLSYLYTVRDKSVYAVSNIFYNFPIKEMPKNEFQTIRQ
ncbi:MAG: hypothetical protein IIX54_04640, partial [Clostridia bacterium]|nr:hypothetical protein [Clostridia bacterium]